MEKKDLLYFRTSFSIFLRVSVPLWFKLLQTRLVDSTTSVVYLTYCRMVTKRRNTHCREILL